MTTAQRIFPESLVSFVEKSAELLPSVSDHSFRPACCFGSTLDRAAQGGRAVGGTVADTGSARHVCCPEWQILCFTDARPNLEREDLHLWIVSGSSGKELQECRRAGYVIASHVSLHLHAGSLKTAGPCLVLIACVLKENKLGKYVKIGMPDEK